MSQIENATSTRSASDLHGEVVVLGAGPGGYTAAFRAADLGRKTVLVERYATLGGVCLNVGCIPSKALLHTAKVIDDAAASADHGVTFGEPEIDLDRLRGWKDGVVGKLTAGLSQLAKRRKIEVVRGTGRLVDSHHLEVATEEGGTTTVGFDHLILAVGSRVVELPGLPWDDPRLMDSTAALELEEIPKRLLVVGGGIIGLELAGVYHSLGSEVSIVELTDGLMPGTDRDLVKPLARRIESRYADIWLSSRVKEIKAQKQGLEVFFEGEATPDSQVFDRVLVCVGRRPNGDRIGAEAAGIEVDEKGFVKVDREMRTNVPHIFAIGDLVGLPMLAHKASHQGKVAAEVASGQPSAFDARAVPSVAYTDPEVAWVGPTEQELKNEGRSYGKGTFPWSASGRSLGMGRGEGMTKLLFEEGAVAKSAGRVIGGGVVGPHAGDLIAEITLAVEMGADAADLGLTIHPHPTLSETVAFAAEAFEGTLTELYKPKRK
jgi:dihydrolipoamide dehydrogenase